MQQNKAKRNIKSVLLNREKEANQSNKIVWVDSAVFQASTVYEYVLWVGIISERLGSEILVYFLQSAIGFALF